MIKKNMLSILFGLLAFGLSTNAFAEEYDFEINGNGLVLCSTLSGDTNCGHAHVILKFNQGAEGAGENTVSATITTRSGYSVTLHSIGEPLAFVTPDDNTFSDSVKIIATLVDENKNIWFLEGDGIFQHYQNRPSDYNLDLVFTDPLGESFTAQILGKSLEIIPENTLLPEVGDEVILIAKGVSNCETEKGDFCGAFNTRTRLNLEVTDVDDKLPSGIAKGQVVLDHPGDVLELYSDSMIWTTTDFPTHCQIELKGLLHDDSDNLYKFEMIGHGIIDHTADYECLLVNFGSMHVYLKNSILTSDGNMIQGQSIGTSVVHYNGHSSYGTKHFTTEIGDQFAIKGNGDGSCLDGKISADINTKLRSYGIVTDTDGTNYSGMANVNLQLKSSCDGISGELVNDGPISVKCTDQYLSMSGNLKDPNGNLYSLVAEGQALPEKVKTPTTVLNMIIDDGFPAVIIEITIPQACEDYIAASNY